MILFIITPAENRPQLPHNWKVPVSTQSCNFLLASTIKIHNNNDHMFCLATQVVEEFTLIDICGAVPKSDDKVYNYARVLCHGERVSRCWWLTLPHFKASGRTKYSLEALRLQSRSKPFSLLSFHAHQVMLNRFVNTRGGLGRNIQNELYNEHIVKLIKNIVTRGYQFNSGGTTKSCSFCEYSPNGVQAVWQGVRCASNNIHTFHMSRFNWCW